MIEEFWVREAVIQSGLWLNLASGLLGILIGMCILAPTSKLLKTRVQSKPVGDRWDKSRPSTNENQTSTELDIYKECTAKL